MATLTICKQVCENEEREKPSRPKGTIFEVTRGRDLADSLLGNSPAKALSPTDPATVLFP